MIIIAKDGVIINQIGNFIHCSDGNSYVLTGKMLTGPRGVVANNVKSISEAVHIVVGLYGGKRF